ncbi:hypothetical protein P7K49_012776 [Saguinus oedipus]|uniref:Ankyrin repeat and SOCS box containing 7 n=1 Tax=Saguinus oedipus TaxID=9490 RepID=A0ABQ9VEB5_SAGOE|nr:hypothetical protein P7K49_012776 [Saguinus oedipus]
MLYVHNADSARMLHHHCRRNPELQEELQIQAAVAAGDVHTVRKMLEQGYSPNGRDANGWTLLHFSAARGKERCVRVFLEHGAGDFQSRNAKVLAWDPLGSQLCSLPTPAPLTGSACFSLSSQGSFSQGNLLLPARPAVIAQS